MNAMETGIAVLALAGLSIGVGTAADDVDAKALHDADCMSCHGTEVYTRDDRRVQSYEALEGQIQRCTMATRVGWNEQQKAAVVDYLNRTFYHFEP